MAALLLEHELRDLKRMLISMRALSKEYTYRARVLRMLRTIEEVFDLQNNGENTFAGMVLRNISVIHDHIRVSSCVTEQKNLWKYPKEGIDITTLPGMSRFLYKFLNKTERTVFVQQLRVMLDDNDYAQMRTLVCKDTVMSEAEHQIAQRKRFDCASKIGGQGDRGLFIQIAKNNPVFSPHLCKKERVQIAYSNMQLLQKIKHMKKRLRKVVTDLRVGVLRGVGTNGDDAKKLLAVERKVKQSVVAFFLQSLTDYKNILNTIRFYIITK